MVSVHHMIGSQAPHSRFWIISWMKFKKRSTKLRVCMLNVKSVTLCIYCVIAQMQYTSSHEKGQTLGMKFSAELGNEKMRGTITAVYVSWQMVWRRDSHLLTSLGVKVCLHYTVKFVLQCWCINYSLPQVTALSPHFMLNYLNFNATM